MSTFELSDDVFNEIIRLSRQYHREAEKCSDSKAFLAGCVMIGAAFEAILLSFANCFPDEAFNSISAPRKKRSVKPLIDWSLADLLRVAKERNWLPSALSTEEEWDATRAKIGDYGELIRQIRNLVHPAIYAVDMTRKRITKKYLEHVFEILEVANEYLMYKNNESLRNLIAEHEVKIT